MPLVSVVMPVYDGEAFIRSAMDSVLGQSMPDLELIVVDDGSRDGTVAIVTERAERDRRVRLLRQENSGRPSFPKNRGIQAATGKYLCFLDHDDLYDTDRLASILPVLQERRNWIAAFHDLRFIDADGTPQLGTYLTRSDFLVKACDYLSPLSSGWHECSDTFFVFQSLHFAAMHTQSVVIALERVDRSVVAFNTEFTICEDTDLWIRLGMRGRMGFLDRPLSSYRQHSTNITRNMERLGVDSIKLHVQNYARIHDRLTPTEARHYRAKIAAYHSDLAYDRYLRYDLAGARQSYRGSLTWDPSRAAFGGYLKSCMPRTVLRQLRGKKSCLSAP